jgi:hypothetical protein
MRRRSANAQFNMLVEDLYIGDGVVGADAEGDCEQYPQNPR